MKNESKLYGTIGLLAGVLIGIFIASNAVNNNQTGMMQMMGMRQGSLSCPMSKSEKNGHGVGMGSSMDEMMESMEEKSGDEFDAAFIESMIIHHQGAIDMAEEAKKNAKHDEIKALADDIITAQTSEIKMMEEWRESWGY